MEQLIQHETVVSFVSQGKPCTLKVVYEKPEGKLETYSATLHIKGVGKRLLFAYEGLPFFMRDSPTVNPFAKPSLSQALIERMLDHTWSLEQDRVNDLLTQVVLEGKKIRKGRSATGSG